MANPYDFSSGALSVYQMAQDKAYKDEYLKLQKQEIDAKAPYLLGLGARQKAEANLLGIQTEGAKLTNAFTMAGIARFQGKKFNFDSFLKSNDYMGVSAAPGTDPVFDEKLNTDLSQQNDLGYGNKDRRYGLGLRTFVDGGYVQHFNDGSVGGVREAEDFEIGQAMLAQQQAQEQAKRNYISNQTTNPNASTENGLAPVTNGTSIQKKEASLLSPFVQTINEDPVKAEKLLNETAKKTDNFRDISSLLMDLQNLDYLKGKITTKDMLANVQTLRKMQNEGFFSAVNEVIYGDSNKALEMYKEFGDDKAQDVERLTPFDLPAEDVPNSKSKEMRKGVLVTYKDGTWRKIDPKKLIMDAVSTKEYLDESYRRTNMIMTGEDKDNELESRSADRREMALGRRNMEEAKLEEKVMTRLKGEFQSEFSRQYNSWLNALAPQFIGDEKLKAAKEKEILEEFRPAQLLSNSNIEAGNSRINVGSLLEASKQMKDPSFLDDQSNFVLGKNGKPLVKEIFGQANVQTKGGVWIPTNVPKTK